MNHGTITEQTMCVYEKHLQLEEKSTATIQKYIRDVNAFRSFIGGEDISKESVIRFKQYLLQSGYASRSVNSMFASLNSLFSFLGWHGCKVKMVRLQNQIYCPEEKELSRAEYARLCTAAKEARELCTAEELWQGTADLAIRCREKGYRVFGATLVPFSGAEGYTPEKQKIADAYNRSVRESDLFDAVIDFYALLGDPAHPNAYLPAYDSGDHIHFSAAAGAHAAAQTVSLFL